MPSLLQISWLIPFAPFAGALVVGLLLVSFDRTMNRLSRPVSYLLIICTAISTVLSFILFKTNIIGQVFDWTFDLANSNLHIGLYVDSISTLIASICGFIFLALMIGSYYLMERKKGYVRYFVFLAFSCSLVFSFLYSGDIFHKLLRL